MSKPQPLCFDDVEVGDSWLSPSRTISEADVVNFAALTGDFNPLHLDHEFARSTPFRQPIAHGLLGLSFVAGLGSESPLMQTVAFVRIVDWKFLHPVYFGDTLHVDTTVVDRQARNHRHGLIVWKRQLKNQDGRVAQEGTFETLVSTSPSLADRKARVPCSTAMPLNGTPAVAS